MNAHQRRICRRRFKRHYPIVSWWDAQSAAIVRAFHIPAQMLESRPDPRILITLNGGYIAPLTSVSEGDVTA
jgi:hypothetical protein